MHCTAHAKTACTALYNARALHCTTLCTARALLCTHTGASYESYTYRILYAQYNRAITGPGALFERGLYCLVRANGWTSIREGLLFEGGFYSRVYGSLKIVKVKFRQDPLHINSLSLIHRVGYRKESKMFTKFWKLSQWRFITGHFSHHGFGFYLLRRKMKKHGRLGAYVTFIPPRALDINFNGNFVHALCQRGPD